MPTFKNFHKASSCVPEKTHYIFISNFYKCSRNLYYKKVPDKSQVPDNPQVPNKFYFIYFFHNFSWKLFSRKVLEKLFFNFFTQLLQVFLEPMFQKSIEKVPGKLYNIFFSKLLQVFMKLFWNFGLFWYFFGAYKFH